MGRRDGLAVLRRQGLHAWIALTDAAPGSIPRAQAVPPAGTGAVAGTLERVTASLESSPLLSVCAAMLLSRLRSTHPLEETP